MKWKIVCLGMLLILVMIFSLFVGGYKFQSFFHLTESEWFILSHIRIPRILCVIVVGSALAMCGGAIQALLKNPLAEPSIIGISSGCSVFAAIGILLFGDGLLAFYMIPAMAFCGGVLTTIIVLFISIKARLPHAIILTGVAVNTVCGGVIWLILFLSNNDALRSINFWMMGSVANVSWKQFALMLCCALFSFVVLLRNAENLDVLALGEENAQMLGVDIKKLRSVVILTTCLCIGVCVAFCGMIGFVGLVTAHIVRLIFGSNNKIVLWISPFLGALILLISDDIARTIVLPAELPIGIITSIIGGPFFIYLIVRKNAGMQ